MMILILALLIIAAGIALAKAIPHDGYGTRPGPRSHHETFGPHPFV